MKTRVEDHGNGFMVVGKVVPRKAVKVLADYVDDIGAYRFACPTFYAGRGSCWLATGPGEVWEGAREASGKEIVR